MGFLVYVKIFAREYIGGIEVMKREGRSDVTMHSLKLIKEQAAHMHTFI